MQLWFKIILLLIVLFCVGSCAWFFLNATAYFQRGMDVIGAAYLWFVAVPILLLDILFAILLIKGWSPKSWVQYFVIFIAQFLALYLSVFLLQGVNENKWAREKIVSDSLKITTDHKYEYRIELINLFQRNSRARLYLVEVSSGKVMYIPIDIETRKIRILRRGEGIDGEGIDWGRLEPTDKESEYILYTKDIGRLPEEKFKIDVIAGTSSKIR